MWPPLNLAFFVEGWVYQTAGRYRPARTLWLSLGKVFERALATNAAGDGEVCMRSPSVVVPSQDRPRRT